MKFFLYIFTIFYFYINILGQLYFHNNQINNVIEYSKNEINEDKQQNENLKQETKTTLLIVLISFVGITLTTLMGLLLKQRRKDNEQLKFKNKEIEKQKKNLQKINTELEELSLIVQQTYNAVKIFDSEWQVVWMNKSHSQLYGYSLDEIKSNKNYKPFGLKTIQEIEQMIDVWFKKKQPITYESERETKSNNKIWVQTTLTPLLNKKGEINKVIAIDSDISLLKEAEKKIRETNQNITESILYAKSIQDTIFPSIESLKKYFPESFIFHKPKSIVSGDFYWFSEKRGKTIIVCGDSTGHGVPGAFMSLMGISFLTKIVTEKGFINTDIILNQMRLNITKHLKQREKKTILNDGMDMSIIAIDKKNKTLEYAGAFLPIYILRNNEIIELSPNKMGISYLSESQKPFSSTQIDIINGDILYLFTDGFYDQFGGKKGEKLKHKKFKEILKKCNTIEPIEKQKQFIEEQFYNWKGENYQVDDVLLMKIKIG